MLELNAGSLYKDYLVLYGENQTPICIQVEDEDLQWKIYCNDVKFDAIDYKEVIITFEDVPYSVSYLKSDNPMKTLGFGK